MKRTVASILSQDSRIFVHPWTLTSTPPGNIEKLRLTSFQISIHVSAQQSSLSDESITLSGLACSRLTGTHSQSSLATLHRCSIDVFREKVCKHLLGRLLAERDLAFRDHRLNQGTLCRCASLVRALVGSQSQFQLWRPSTHEP